MNTENASAKLRFGIRKKFLLLCCSIIAITMALSSYFAYRMVAKSTEEQTDTFHKMSVQATANQIDNFIESIAAQYYQIISDEQVQDFLEDELGTSVWDKVFKASRLQQKLSASLLATDFIHSVAVVRQDGSVIATSNISQYTVQNLQSQWQAELEQVDTQTDHVYITTPQVIRSEISDRVFTYLKKVYDPYQPGDVSGYVVINLYCTALERLLQPLYDQFDIVQLLDLNSTVIIEQKKELAADVNLSHQRLYAVVLKNYPFSLEAHDFKQQLTRDLATLRCYFVCLTLLALFTTMLLLTPFLSHLISPIYELAKKMKIIAKNNLDVQINIHTHDELQILGDGLNDMTQQLKAYSVKEKEHQLNEMNMEYSILMAQINPHFIYNALNSIKYLTAVAQKEQIEEVINSLIHLLQDSIRMGEERVFTTLRQEIEITRYYCNIQQIIYPGVFCLTVDASEAALESRIPKTILQPLVENSILHGLLPRGKDGVIAIQASAQKGHLLITLSDNGVGIEPEVLQTIRSNAAVPCQSMRHIGMANIIKRTQYLYSGRAHIDIYSTVGTGTVIEMDLPLSET